MQRSDTKLISVYSIQYFKNDLTNHFVFRWVGSGGAKFKILIEPLARAWIVINICQGVISAINVKLFNDAFGAEKIDFAQFQKDLLTAINRTVKASILDDIVRKVHAALNSIGVLFIYTLALPVAHCLRFS